MLHSSWPDWDGPPPSLRSRWPWIALLAASGTFMVLGFAQLRISPERVPPIVPLLVAWSWPLWLLGLGGGRWTARTLMGIVLLAFGVFAVCLVHVVRLVFLADTATIRHVPPLAIERGTVRLVEAVDAGSHCSDLYAMQAGGWLWQSLRQSTCRDDRGVMRPYRPNTVVAEQGRAGGIVMLAAEAPGDGVGNTGERLGLGVVRVGAGGWVVSVQRER